MHCSSQFTEDKILNLSFLLSLNTIYFILKSYSPIEYNIVYIISIFYNFLKCLNLNFCNIWIQIFWALNFGLHGARAPKVHSRYKVLYIGRRSSDILQYKFDPWDDEDMGVHDKFNRNKIVDQISIYSRHTCSKINE
jgi:hypothetical protein